jgi:dihydrofolate reductase
MARLIVTEFITLDGVIEDPGGEEGHPHSGWVGEHMGPEQQEFKLNEVLEAGSHLLGRVTYESFAGAWPQREGPFAEKVNTMPKHVVSSTLADPLGWENSTVIPVDSHLERIRELKAADGGPILVAGSATLVRSLIENELVDELRLMTFPVMIGGGKRPFPDDRSKHTLKLTGSTAFETGVTVSVYEPG